MILLAINYQVTTIMKLISCCIAGLCLASITQAAEVELSDKVRDNFGITTVPVNGAQVAQRWQAQAQVLDATTLVSTLAELRSAHSAAMASAAESKRLEALHQADSNASLKSVEAARAQAVSDQARVQMLRAQLLSSWGNGIARMADDAREQLAKQILNGSAVLIRAELNSNGGKLAADKVRLSFLSGEASVSAQLLGKLPQSINSLGTAYLLRASINADQDLQPGQVLQAELQDVSRIVTGIKLPRAALLRWQGQQFVYVETAANHYLRKAVQVSQWLEDAALLKSGLSAGDKVVTTGAGLLLGAETAPAEEEEDEPAAAVKE